MVQKSEKLIEFGAEGVSWILTESRKVLLMRPNRRLEVFKWTDEVPLFDEYSLCLQTILEEEGTLPTSEHPNLPKAWGFREVTLTAPRIAVAPDSNF